MAGLVGADKYVHELSSWHTARKAVIDLSFNKLLPNGETEAQTQPTGQKIPVERLIARQAMAELISPLDVTEQGAVFQIMDRQGKAATWGNSFRMAADRELTKVEIHKGLPAAQPFLLEREVHDSNDPTKKVLIALGAKQKKIDEPHYTFNEWAIEIETTWDPTLVEAALVLLQKPVISDLFDRFRVHIIVAATLAKHQETSAFSYIVGATDIAQLLTSPVEKIQANMMLKSAMDYAHSVNIYNSMAVIGNGQRIQAPLRPLPV